MREISAPLSFAEFTNSLNLCGPFESNPHLAVGISGGGDSLCLALLAHNWAQERGGKITALTVDHGLRPESAQEALTVKAWCTALGISHVTLNWKGIKPTTGIQEMARQARIELLTHWCHTHDVLHLLLGHHADDEAETWLMRAARGFHLSGLSGIPRISYLPTVRILRPLLPFSRARLHHTLHQKGLAFLADPSNQNLIFERVRWRTLLELFPPSFTPSIHNLRTACCTAFSTLHKDTLAAWTAFLHINPNGYAVFSLEKFRALNTLHQRLGLKWLLTTLDGGAYPPNEDRITHLVASLSHLTPTHATLHRCSLTRHKNHIYVGREKRAVSAPLRIPPFTNAYWDQRFFITNQTACSLLIQGWQPRFTEPAELPRGLWAGLPTCFYKGESFFLFPTGAKTSVLQEEGITIEFRPTRPFTVWGMCF